MEEELEVGQRVLLTCEERTITGEKCLNGTILLMGPGGKITRKEVVIELEQGGKMILRFFPEENVWRRFFQEPLGNPGELCFNTKEPTYCVERLD